MKIRKKNKKEKTENRKHNGWDKKNHDKYYFRELFFLLQPLSFPFCFLPLSFLSPPLRSLLLAKWYFYLAGREGGAVEEQD